MASPLSLPLCIIEWTATAQTTGAMPQWKGSTLRGAIGWAITRVAAGAPRPPWPGLAAHATFSDSLFSPQIAWADQQAGTPWHLQCTDTRTTWQNGDRLTGRFICFGTWPAWLFALWREVIEDAIAVGFGPHAPRFTLTGWDVAPLAWLPTPATAQALRLTTITAARLQDRGQECTHLSAPAIGRSLLRRWRHLHQQLAGDEPPLPAPYPELSNACDALTGTHTDAPATIARWSNRQHRAVDMPGLTGTVTITGPTLALLAPILAQAPLLHIGKQPNFGLGMVEVGWGNELNPVEIL